MLWRVKDFKGLRTAELDIRQGKATILTGVNSSGKSSIIQSLLLAAQSLQGENQMILNGPLVRLGNAQDLVRNGSESGAIELTIGLAGDVSEEVADVSASQAVFDLMPADENSTLRTRRLQIGPADQNELNLEMSRDNARAGDVALAMEVTQDMGTRDVLHIKSLLNNRRRQLRTYAVMKGLRPIAVVQLMKSEDIAKRYRSLLDAVLHGLENGPADSTSNVTTRLGGTAFIREFVRLMFQSDDTSGAHRRLFSGARNGNPYAFEIAWMKLNHDERKSLIDCAVLARQQRPYIVLRLRKPARFFNVVDGLLESQLADTLGTSYEALHFLGITLDTFADRVQYLGPLRDEPRVVWNHWNELARGLPVGTRGEYSAAVLSRSNSTLVKYVTPGSREATATLSQAVNEWLAYLDIGDAVAARSHSKLGVGLDLRVNGQVRDLTSVGVGVSQALPLLIGILTSPRDAIFIVEQPELHLHPSVQARLADFMIEARPDLTFIIETHSESFITRIRRRAAEGKFNVDDIDITFVEPSIGGSSARVLEVSEFGDLSEWPEGFLSASEEDIRAILKANIERSTGITDAR